MGRVWVLEIKISKKVNFAKTKKAFNVYDTDVNKILASKEQQIWLKKIN